MDEPGDGLSQGASLLKSVAFHLDVEAGLTIAKQVEDLAEQGDGGLRVFISAFGWMAQVEPRPDINLAQFARRKVCDLARSEPRAAQSGIVNHDRHTVARETHIEFNSVRAIRHGPLEGQQSILRRERRSSPVADNEGHLL